MKNRKKQANIVCRCNEVDRQQIQQAILDGAKTLNEIFDATTAGVGACGGSCRGKLQHLLKSYQESGQFPDKIVDIWVQKEPTKK